MPQISVNSNIQKYDVTILNFLSFSTEYSMIYHFPKQKNKSNKNYYIKSHVTRINTLDLFPLIYFFIVATWREISPGGSSEESRKSRKMSTPTAAGVSSSSQSFPSKYHYPQIIWVLLLLLCFCWT